MRKKNNNYDHTEKYTEIGYNIAYYRKHANLTQEQLAELVGISRAHLSAIEAPKVNRNLSVELVFDIAEALHVDAYKLIKVRE